MKSLYIIGVIFVVYLTIANSAPIFDDPFEDEFEKLFESLRVDCNKKFGCPAGTVSCSKNSTTSADRKTIITQVKCLDASGELLNRGGGITTVANPNPNGVHNSYEYFGSYTGGSNTVVNTNHGSTNPSTNVETFEK